MKKKQIILIPFIFTMILSLLAGCGGKGTNSSSTTTTTTTTTTISLTPPTPTAAYYVATNGSDSNSGTISAPFATLEKALTVISPGEAIYVRGGTYSCSSAITLSSSGTSSGMYMILAYPGESPIINFSGEGSGTSTYGFYVTGDYWYLKGLEVEYAAGKGVRVTGSHNVFNQIISHNNNDSGFFIGLNKTSSNDGSLAAYNQCINCDSYLNCDPSSSTGVGGNADGFSCKLHPGTGNLFYGCRAWENSDDGWDLYMADYPVTIKYCWTWHNGDPNSFSYTGSNWGGNGSGFKMGGGSSYGAHIVQNCVAFDINYGQEGSNHKAFDQNGSSGALSGVTMYNCLAFSSMYGFYFAASPTDGTYHTLKNCVAFNNSKGNTNLASNTVEANNSWNLSITATSADFVSIATSDAKAERGSDGSLPTGFARLASGSQLIDKGVNVGLSYSGSAPDLGAYEKE